MSLGPLNLAMHGATGRMGARILSLIDEADDLTLAAAIERADHPRIGGDVGPIIGLGPLGVSLSSVIDPGTPVDVVIDFSVPEASLNIGRWCGEHGVPLVVGTTGFEPAQRTELEQLADRIPILIAANFSKAVNLLFHLVGVAARSLGQSADIEIVERHHRFKKDAPSGTALRLAEVAAEGINTYRFVHGRHGLIGERPTGEIGLHALRTGDNPGEHTVVFGLMGECLELSHRALNRDGFSRGALDAARYLAGKPPGRYAMEDLLQLGGG
ncbi:4-hydroxy-tetrahydrodipicolinate reductase [Tautonia marina]|uniref:4-hydroxy-tetrahydrodipicolinate reductase n=1 Tax=Tautonia marina TaxID=2653855 RepID=UPI001260ACA4|nr:4-hydroxy-tetrahydrodipicolinate reductase [Tautonia marina]